MTGMTQEEFYNRLTQVIDNKTLVQNLTHDYIEVKLPIKPSWSPELKRFIYMALGDADSNLEGWNLTGLPNNYKIHGSFIKVDNETIIKDDFGALKANVEDIAIQVLNYENIKDVLKEMLSGYFDEMKTEIATAVFNEVSGMLSGEVDEEPEDEDEDNNTEDEETEPEDEDEDNNTEDEETEPEDEDEESEP